MSDPSLHSVSLSRGLPETVLPEPPADWVSALRAALVQEPDRRRSAVAALAAAHPRYIAAWVELSRLAHDDVEAYAYARVGYHRGLDALRGAGWHGTGYVRSRHEQNRPFLDALNALYRIAGVIGEADEEERCRLFLHQLDPDWTPADRFGRPLPR